VKNATPLAPSEFLVRVTDDLMVILEKSSNLEEWDRYRGEPRAKDLQEHLDHLSRFKSL